MKKVSYSAVVLTSSSQEDLIIRLSQVIPDWHIYAHHMTICMGSLNNDRKKHIGTKQKLEVYEIGGSDQVIAVKVKGFESDNKIPHITLAVNKDKGGRPVMSNDIENWIPIAPFNVWGIVEEVVN